MSVHICLLNLQMSWIISIPFPVYFHHTIKIICLTPHKPVSYSTYVKHENLIKRTVLPHCLKKCLISPTQFLALKPTTIMDKSIYIYMYMYTQTHNF